MTARLRRRASPALVTLVSCILLLLRVHADSEQRHPHIDPSTTLERLLPLAEAGDPSIQNALGFMFFYAEGVPLDYDQAHMWFHRSAEQGHAPAQRNLGLFHSRSRERVPERFHDPVEANFWFSVHAASVPNGSRLASNSYKAFIRTAAGIEELQALPPGESGEQIYFTFCAGCHGFEDAASYPQAPALLAGERMGQPDDEIVRVILDGRNSMPGWRETLTMDQARKVVDYIQSNQVVRTSNPSETHAEVIEQTEIIGPGEQTAEQVYTRFCGGCHGFNGISYYVNSPSFALGERMDKSDSELESSIRNGLGVMPGWERILGTEKIQALVQFIRTLAPAYQTGIDHELRVAPELYFLFNPKGENNNDWHVRGGAR